MTISHKNSRDYASQPRGAAVIFSIILATTMLLIAGTTSESHIRAYNRQQDLFRSEQAKYAARAAAEEAIAVASGELVGYEASDLNSVEWDTNNDPGIDVTGEYTIYALARGFSSPSPATPSCQGLGCLATAAGSCISGSSASISGCLALPIPGTGDASSECEFWNIENQPWYGNPNLDCNWNKLAYQDTVTLPLYYYNASGNLQNPADTGLSQFILRVRTPDGQMLQTSESDATPNDVVLAWEISGACDLDGDDDDDSGDDDDETPDDDDETPDDDDETTDDDDGALDDDDSGNEEKPGCEEGCDVVGENEVPTREGILVAGLMIAGMLRRRSTEETLERGETAAA